MVNEGMTKLLYLISGNVMSDPEYITVSVSRGMVIPAASIVDFPENFIAACPAPCAVAVSTAVVKNNSAKIFFIFLCD